MRFSAGIIIQQWLELLPQLECSSDRDRAAAALSAALFAAQSSDLRYASEVAPEMLDRLFVIDGTSASGDVRPCESE